MLYDIQCCVGVVVMHKGGGLSPSQGDFPSGVWHRLPSYFNAIVALREDLSYASGGNKSFMPDYEKRSAENGFT